MWRNLRYQIPPRSREGHVGVPHGAGATWGGPRGAGATSGCHISVITLVESSVKTLLGRAGSVTVARACKGVSQGREVPHVTLY